MSNIGPDFAYKTFFRVGSLEIQESNPEESLGRAKAQDLSDIGPNFAYKTFFRVGSHEIQGSNPKESLDCAKTCQT